MGRLERFAAGMVEAGWLATVVLTPMFIDKNGADVFEGAKAGLLQAIALVTLAAWGARVLGASRDAAARTPAPVERMRWLRTPVVATALAVLAVQCIAAVLSLSPGESVWGHPGRAYGLLTQLAGAAIFAAMLGNLRTQAQLRRLVTALILPSIPIAGYAIAQRLRLEPLNISARETDIQRATSLLGQPVFLAAYLAMVIPFTVLRLRELQRAVTGPGTHRGLAIGVHAFVLAVQALGLLSTESRGPLLGLFAGAAMAALALVVRHDHRKLLRVVAVASVVGLVIVFAIAPALRKSSNPEVARIATRVSELFATTGGGGQFRTTTWNVAVRVVTNQAPIELADGTYDPHPGIRKVIGYGPEMQHAVTPPFYDDELPRLFGYFHADRLHHDLWDALIATGVIGLAAALALQAALLRTLFGRLGLLGEAKEGRQFWAVLGGSTALGVVGAWVTRGPGYAFLGLELGALAGLALWLAVRGLRRRPQADEAAVEPVAHEPLLLAALVAIVGHLVETSFSFTVVATGAIFWVICALVVLVSGIVPPPPARSQATARTSVADDRTAWRDPIASGALLAWLTMTLGFVFIGGTRLDPKPGRVLWDSLTLLSDPPRLRAPVVPIVVVGSVVLAALVLALAPRGEGRAPLFGRRLRWTLGIGVVIGTAFWLQMSTLLAKRGALSKIPGRHAIDNIVLRVEAIESYYIWAGLVLVLAALHLGVSTRLTGVTARWWQVAAAAVSVAVALAAIRPITLRPAEAAAAMALGTSLRNERSLRLAEEAFAYAAAVPPRSSTYAAALAKTYNLHARNDNARAPALYQLANQTMLEAIERNPALSENCTNLALIRSNWAQQMQSPELAASVPELYARALRLNPKDARIWQMWAGVQLRLLRDSSGALRSARRALALEPSSKAEGLVEQIQAAIASRGAAQPR